MDYQMLKELKKKMDYDNEKRKFSAQNQTLQDLVTKNMKTTPKTFSPDHKPINPKISQNSEFCKNNANTISSKLNYVNIDGFFEFKEKFNKNMIKKRDSPTRQRVFSFHKKNNNNNETGSTYGLPLKQQVITETMNSKEVYGSPIKNIMKKQEISGFAKNDNNSEINSLCKGEEKGNKSHFNEEINEKNSLSNEKNTIKKTSHKKTASYGCNPFSFFDSKVIESPNANKFHEKSDSFYDNVKLFKTKTAQKSISIRYITKTQKGFLITNTQKSNQDTFISVPNFGRNIHNHLFAVCDGHGIHGHLVSNFLKEHLPKCLLANPDFMKNPQKSIHDAIEHIQQVLENSFIDTGFSGSTLIALLILNNQIISSNIGDSRAILAKKNDNSWNFLNLSYDHKPDIPLEKERILKQGGIIEPFKDEDGRFLGPLRVWHSNGKSGNNCGIAMTRSIGDKIVKSVGVTWEPEIREFKIEEDDKFIVLGSDGLWEVITNQECVEMIGKYYEKLDLEGAAEFLMGETMRRWVNVEQNAIDDITFIIIFLAHY